MKGQLKQQVATSTGWTLGEKILTALVQFVVRVLILRMLFPDDSVGDFVVCAGNRR